MTMLTGQKVKVPVRVIAAALIILAAVLPGCSFLRRTPTAKPRERVEFMMDTMVRITWFDTADDGAVDQAFAAIEAVEAKMSAHLEDSEVAKINAMAGVAPVRVSSDTLATIQIGLDVGKLSGGAFDITIKPLVDLWGIGKKETYVPSDDEIARARALVDYRKVRVDAARSEVMLENPGMGIDLGGVAKGYAVDAAAQVLRECGVKHALINAGGDVYVIGDKPGGVPWRIGVQHPRKSEEFIAVAELTDTAAVSSGDYQRYVEFGGQRFHHIIDPRLGRPSAGLVSTTVLHPSAAWADALSTAVFVLGPEHGMALANAVAGAEALVVTPDGKVMQTGGLQRLVKVLPW